MNTQLTLPLKTNVPKGQTLTVLEMLEEGPVCGTRFLEAHIPRYAARIWDLRNLGYIIETRTCYRVHHRHRSRQIEYTLKGKPL